MKKFFIILFVFLLASPVFSDDFYTKQTGTGNGLGGDCANAKTYSTLVWGTDFGDDDTLHLCDTFTTTVNTGGGGSVGHPITIQFEAGAKISAAYWGATTAAAMVIDEDYIVLDGNDVGIIEATDNGNLLGNQAVDATGLYIYDTTGVEVKNLTVQNIYVRTSASIIDDRNSRGIYAYKNNSLSIHDNIVNGAQKLIMTTAGTANKDGIDIYNNILTKGAGGIVITLAGAVNQTGVKIYNNSITDFANWGEGSWGPTSWHHIDGIHTWGNYPGNNLEVEIYNNYIGGDFGETITAWIYLTDYTFPALVYNNVFFNTGGINSTPGLGFLAYHCLSANGDISVYNNTFVGKGKTNTGGMGIYFSGSGTHTYSADIRNNIFDDLYIAIHDPRATPVTITSDYNNFNVGNVGRDYTGWRTTLASWQTYLGDADCAGSPTSDNECNSFIGDPLLNATYYPTALSPTVDVGEDLSAHFTVDKDGYTRSIWDIGAYELTTSVTGTIIADNQTESGVVAGGYTIVIVLTNDTWHADVGADNAITDEIIAGIDSNGVEGTGWDAVVKANMVFGDITRELDDVTVTILLGAEPTYAITANETITITIPASALVTSTTPIVAYPTFFISNENPVTSTAVRVIGIATGAPLIGNID